MRLTKVAAKFVAILAMAGCIPAVSADQNSGSDVLSVLELNHAEAETMSSVVEQVFHGEVLLAVDERTNALVLRGRQDSIDRVVTILKKLDREIKKPQANNNVGVPRSDVSPDSKMVLNLRRRHRELKTQLSETEYHLKRLQQQKVQLEAKGKLDELELEAKLADAISKAELLSMRSNLAEENTKLGTSSAEDALLAKFEAESAKRSIAILKRKIAFHRDLAQFAVADKHHEAEMASMAIASLLEEFELFELEKKRLDESMARDPSN